MEPAHTYCCTECGAAFTLEDLAGAATPIPTPPILACPLCGTDAAALRCSGWEKYTIQSSIYYATECRRLREQREEEQEKSA